MTIVIIKDVIPNKYQLEKDRYLKTSITNNTMIVWYKYNPYV